MGCGHSKINMYSKKSKGKSSSKKSVSSEVVDSEEEEGIETESDNIENSDDCDQRKTIRVKPFGGPLLAQAEISTSQQDFFKMLDEKIQNGPDYNSESESEKAAETMRLRSLLKDWETASQNSRSLPSTPKRWTPTVARDQPNQIIYNNQSQITQSAVHQSYGVVTSQPTPASTYRPVPYNNHQMAHPYQAMYGAPPPANYIARQDNHTRQVVTYDQRTGPIVPSRQADMNNRHPDLPGRPMSNYEQRTTNTLPAGSYLARTLENANRPMTTGFEQQRTVQVKAYGAESSPKRQQDVVGYSPTHRMYGGAVAITKGNNSEVMYKPVYSNGDLIQQQQMYNHQATQQYQTQQQYMVPQEPVLSQYQQPVVYREPPKKLQYPNAMSNMPIVVQSQQTEMMNSLNRKQYELT